MVASPKLIALTGRAVLHISGPDARSFLQGLITNDMAQLAPGRPLYAALLSPQGKYLHDFLLFDQGDQILLDAEAARLPDLVKRLKLYRLRAKVELTETEARVLAVLNAGFGEPDPRHPALGNRLIVAPGDTLPDLPAGDFDDYDRLRLSLGIPDGARDWQVDKTLALEGNLDTLHGVSFTKGCYVGQELTARTKYRGLLKKRLFAVRVNGETPPADTPVLADGRDAGLIRSGAGDRALAFLRIEAVEAGAPLTAGSSGITPDAELGQ